MNDHMLTHGYEFHEPLYPSLEDLGYQRETLRQVVSTKTRHGVAFRGNSRTEHIEADEESMILDVKKRA